MILTRPSTFSLLAAAAALSVGSAASGQLALNDFTGSTVDANGVVDSFIPAEGFTLTSTTPGASKPILTVADDSAGHGSGNALFVRNQGSSSELTAFLDSPITIGPNVGDGIALEFKWRVNTDSDSLPASGSDDFRFGLFSDADNQIGDTFGTFTTYDDDNLPITTQPAVFGTTPGEYDTDGTGPMWNDFGIHVETAFNRNVPDPNISNDSITGTADNPWEGIRIRDENENQNGVNSGSGNTIVFGGYNPPNAETGFAGGSQDLVQDGANAGELRNGNSNTFLMELIRQNDGTEDRIFGRLTITNALGVTIFEDDDPFSQSAQNTFDYIVFENQNGDWDYVIDDVRVFNLPEVSSVLEGDYDGNGFVSQADLDLVLLNWGDAALPGGFDENAIPGGGPFDSLISQNELDGVLLNWGNGTPPVNAIPEPTSLALLGLGGMAMLKRRRA